MARVPLSVLLLVLLAAALPPLVLAAGDAGDLPGTGSATEEAEAAPFVDPATGEPLKSTAEETDGVYTEREEKAAGEKQERAGALPSNAFFLAQLSVYATVLAFFVLWNWKPALLDEIVATAKGLVRGKQPAKDDDWLAGTMRAISESEGEDGDDAAPAEAKKQQ